MEADIVECDKLKESEDTDTFQDEQKLIQPASLKDPKLEQLKEALVLWINSTLKAEHIVVQSLEEDLYDGLVLHHLLTRFSGVHLPVNEIALTSAAQIQKLQVILEELDQRLGLEDRSQIKWDVKLIHNKDLLATLHLLVAMVRRFQPEVDLPANVKVEVVVVEVSRNGLQSHAQTEVLTEERDGSSDSLGATQREDPIDQLLGLQAHKVNAVKQFADGVILLLLIGQLEGFFLPLHQFNRIPVNSAEMLDNVTLALDLLNDCGFQMANVEPQDIVSRDVAATLKVLYALFKKHKGK
ncbi:gamma-parvin isoform X2 [Nelusetta ayraudi]|uniref:gamma-parvin isoform X2 n=1 Tax=Nelusetta ayraudi TaxID=303726 RepID=UPI003F715138